MDKREYEDDSGSDESENGSTPDESDGSDYSDDDDLAGRCGPMATSTRGHQDDDFDFDDEGSSDEDESTNANQQNNQQQPPRQTSARIPSASRTGAVITSRMGSASQNAQSSLSTSQRITSASQRGSSAATRVSSAVSSKSTVVKNQPFDEVIEAMDESDAESVPSEDGTPRGMHPRQSSHGPRMTSAKLQNSHMTERRKVDASIASQSSMMASQDSMMTSQDMGNSRRNMNMSMEGSDSGSEGDSGEEDEDEDETSDEDEDDDMGKSMEYNPKEYEQLPVSAEIKQLFAYVSAYKPQEIELDTRLKPFIPDFIPAVGELDPFLKVPRPDGKPDFLGLKVLDEPAAKQSDPTVVTLNISYRDIKSSKPVTVINSIEQADKNPKRVQKWIDDIRELHKTKPPPTVNYSKVMPDINTLMQAWPEPFEEMLQKVELPGADVDMDLEDYVKMICALLDIPTYNNPIESLHLLFTLYLEFKANQHFSQQMEQM